MTCKIDNCERNAYALQLCHRHYMQDYRKRETKREKHDIENIKSWLLSLERERYDTTWKNPKPVEKPTFVQPTPAGQKLRDQTMYHAGRYAAGARDKQAIKASVDVNRYIGGN